MTPRGATSPHRHKMRFHCVINLESRRGARRDPFGRNELRSSPGLSWRLQARREAGADTFPVLAHHLPLKIYISVMSLSASQDLHFRNVPVRLSASAFPCEARAAGDTAHALEKIGIRVNGNGERNVHFPLSWRGWMLYHDGVAALPPREASCGIARLLRPGSQAVRRRRGQLPQKTEKTREKLRWRLERCAFSCPALR